MAGIIGRRKQIKLIDVAPTKDANGYLKPGSSVLFSGWADVIDPGSSRLYQNGQASIDYTKVFRIRHNGGLHVGADTRIVYDGKKFTVESIEKEKEKKFYFIIKAKAVT